jgi:hypothetical protein
VACRWQQQQQQKKLTLTDQEKISFVNVKLGDAHNVMG